MRKVIHYVLLALGTLGLVAGAFVASAPAQTVVETRTEVREYPIHKRVIVHFERTGVVEGVTGEAVVFANENGSTVRFNLSGMPTDREYYAYTVDESGDVERLGTIPVREGTTQISFKSRHRKFRMFVSPESELTTYGPNTTVVLRSR
jgi:hypothetical protein